MRTISIAATTIIIATAMQLQAMAQEPMKGISGNFRKGTFAGVEMSTGTAIRASSQSTDYGLYIFVGYRFLPQIAVAAGIGGSNAMATSTTAMPIFIRLRSDILDKKVSPIVQADFGYAVQFAHSKRSTSELLYNSETFKERYTVLGFGSQEEYIDACIKEFMKHINGQSGEEAELLIAEERERIVNQLCCFFNGQRSYLNTDALDELGCLSADGFFGNLTAGISIGVGKEYSRISAGFSVGFAQYSHSIRLRDWENNFIKISVPATLPDGTPIIIARTSINENPILLDLRLRVSWEF